MLISVRHLVDRLRHPRTRADELASLRARFAAQPSRWQASAQQVAVAERLRALREELSRELAGVEACSGCARGHPLPAGHWPGGHCCGGRTLDIFSAEEVRALDLAGTRASDLVAPAGDHAGCAFRGPSGCSLEPAHRPTLCVRYVCSELREELLQRPDWRRIAELLGALRDEFRRFTELETDEKLGEYGCPVVPGL